MKTVWITGSSSGIGKALAHEFNAQGFFTILSARRTNVLVEVQSQLPFPENSAILTLDLNEFKKASTWSMRHFVLPETLIYSSIMAEWAI